MSRDPGDLSGSRDQHSCHPAGSALLRLVLEWRPARGGALQSSHDGSNTSFSSAATGSVESRGGDKKPPKKGSCSLDVLETAPLHLNLPVNPENGMI